MTIRFKYLKYYSPLKAKVTQSCLTVCDPMDCIVHGILQARILEWVAFPFFRGSSQPTSRSQVSRIWGGFFTSWAMHEVKDLKVGERQEKHKQQKKSINKLVFIKINNFCRSKEATNKVKRQATEWRKYSKIILVVKSLPAMQETGVPSLGG